MLLEALGTVRIELTKMLSVDSLTDRADHTIAAHTVLLLLVQSANCLCVQI
jgi:hypothetical protein